MQSSPITLVNIVDSPYCTCCDIEYTHHFLFVCYQFTDLRRDLINSVSVSDVCQPNFNVMIYHFIICKVMKYEETKKMFLAFPWVVTSTGPGRFMVVCVFYDGNSRRLNRKWCY